MRTSRRIGFIGVIIALCMFSGVTLISCATLAPAVDTAAPVVDRYVQNASIGLNVLDSIQQMYFKLKPNDALQQKIVTALNKARNILNSILLVVDGSQALAQSKVDEGWANYKDAYLELIGLMGDLGVKRAAPRGQMSALPGGGYVVPDPLIFQVTK